VGTLKTAPNLRDAEKIEAQGGASEAEGAIGKGDQDPAAVPRMPERDPEPYEPPLGSPGGLPASLAMGDAADLREFGRTFMTGRDRKAARKAARLAMRR
jgi:hypothetical protein